MLVCDKVHIFRFHRLFVGMSAQRIKHIHPLIRVDPNIVYREHYGRWTCDGCLRSPGNSEMPFHCAICKFDLCDKCYPGEIHPRHHHPLFYSNMSRVYARFGGGWRCDGCGRNRAQLNESHGFHCPIDEFDLCNGCFNGKMYQIHIHELKPADSVLLYGESTGMWRCDSCGRNGSQIGRYY